MGQTQLCGAELELIGVFPADRLIEEINQFIGVALRLAGRIVVAGQDQQTNLVAWSPGRLA